MAQRCRIIKLRLQKYVTCAKNEIFKSKPQRMTVFQRGPMLPSILFTIALKMQL